MIFFSLISQILFFCCFFFHFPLLLEEIGLIFRIRSSHEYYSEFSPCLDIAIATEAANKKELEIKQNNNVITTSVHRLSSKEYIKSCKIETEAEQLNYFSKTQSSNNTQW